MEGEREGEGERERVMDVGDGEEWEGGRVDGVDGNWGSMNKKRKDDDEKEYDDEEEEEREMVEKLKRKPLNPPISLIYSMGYNHNTNTHNSPIHNTPTTNSHYYKSPFMDEQTYGRLTHTLDKHENGH